MRAVEPIRERKQLEMLKLYFKSRNSRDYLLFVMGINSNLRISDLLQLRVGNVKNAKGIKTDIETTESKTKKVKRIRINPNMEKALSNHLSENDLSDEDYLFESRKNKAQPITRQQAHHILSTAGDFCGIEKPISPHSLRKTWGYHAWKMGVSPILIMEALNHSNLQITKRYLGILQEDLDEIYLNLNL